MLLSAAVCILRLLVDHGGCIRYVVRQRNCLRVRLPRRGRYSVDRGRDRPASLHFDRLRRVFRRTRSISSAVCHAGRICIEPAELIQQCFTIGFICANRLVVGTVRRPAARFARGAVRCARIVDVVRHLQFHVECDFPIGTDAAVTRLKQNADALAASAEIRVKIVQRLEVEEILLVVVMHIRCAAVRLRNLIEVEQHAVIQRLPVLQRCKTCVDQFLSGLCYLDPVAAVRLRRVQNRQIHLPRQCVRRPCRLRFRRRDPERAVDRCCAVAQRDPLVHDRRRIDRCEHIRIELLQHVQRRQIVVLGLVVRLRIEDTIRDIVRVRNRFGVVQIRLVGLDRSAAETQGAACPYRGLQRCLAFAVCTGQQRRNAAAAVQKVERARNEVTVSAARVQIQSLRYCQVVVCIQNLVLCMIRRFAAVIKLQRSDIFALDRVLTGYRLNVEIADHTLHGNGQIPVQSHRRHFLREREQHLHVSCREGLGPRVVQRTVFRRSAGILRRIRIRVIVRIEHPERIACDLEVQNRVISVAFHSRQRPTAAAVAAVRVVAAVVRRRIVCVVRRRRRIVYVVPIHVERRRTLPVADPDVAARVRLQRPEVRLRGHLLPVDFQRFAVKLQLAVHMHVKFQPVRRDLKALQSAAGIVVRPAVVHRHRETEAQHGAEYHVRIARRIRARFRAAVQIEPARIRQRGIVADHDIVATGCGNRDRVAVYRRRVCRILLVSFDPHPHRRFVRLAVIHADRRHIEIGIAECLALRRNILAECAQDLHRNAVDLVFHGVFLPS